MDRRADRKYNTMKTDRYTYRRDSDTVSPQEIDSALKACRNSDERLAAVKNISPTSRAKTDFLSRIQRTASRKSADFLEDKNTKPQKLRLFYSGENNVYRESQRIF